MEQGDTRLIRLRRWLIQELDLPPYRIAPASSDASFRRYFRVTWEGHSRIVMDAPPDKEDVRPFLEISRLLESLGVHVPEVLEQDIDNGFLLLTDFGSQQYLDQLNDSTAGRLYGDALQSLIRLQLCPEERLRRLPSYDALLLQTEMELFRDWYLLRLQGVTLGGARLEQLERAFRFLIRNALEQPVVLVHRDYHSRNLMVTDPNPGVLDFQDAVAGPVTYDLVSLLRDCYLRWPERRVLEWVECYRSSATEAGILRGVGREQLLRWFDLMGVQRHLKAVGIFARLHLRDGKSGYLGDIPRTQDYLRAVCPRYPELAGVTAVLKEVA